MGPRPQDLLKVTGTDEPRARRSPDGALTLGGGGCVNTPVLRCRLILAPRVPHEVKLQAPTVTYPCGLGEHSGEQSCFFQAGTAEPWVREGPSSDCELHQLAGCFLQAGRLLLAGPAADR